jgi:hypothetical protein
MSGSIDVRIDLSDPAAVTLPGGVIFRTNMNTDFESDTFVPTSPATFSSLREGRMPVLIRATTHFVEELNDPSGATQRRQIATTVQEKKSSVVLLPKDAENVKAVWYEGLEKQVSDSIHPIQLIGRIDPDRTSIRLIIGCSGPPENLAYRVFLVQNGRWRELGAVVFHRNRTNRFILSENLDVLKSDLTVTAPEPKDAPSHPFVPGSYSVVLKPCPITARTSQSISRYAGVELRFDRVPLTVERFD